MQSTKQNTPALRVSPSTLSALQQTKENIRNICILAHVDHGKTTLTDNLVCANGIISEKLAGKIRYLDNTEEEQIRGITMKSSAISLLYQPDAENSTSTPYLINLVDSPGHVDFSFDVSTAVRLCDGALIVIDVVEGVCAQTHAVLRQAFQEGIQPCLVLNKIDRLQSELQFTTQEAEERLHRIIEQSNAILSSLLRVEILKRDELKDMTQEVSQEEIEKMDIDREREIEELEKSLLFSPTMGNVVFASATDGWAFSLGLFARKLSEHLGIPPGNLRQALWGTYFYQSKTKSILAKPTTKSYISMFCQFVLEPIWTTYAALLAPISVSNETEDLSELRILMRKLKIGKLVSDRELCSRDRRSALQLVMRKWLPLAPTVLKVVTRMLPSPVQAQCTRLQKLLHANLELTDKIEPKQRQVINSLRSCESNVSAPVVVFVCKMISMDKTLLSDFSQIVNAESESSHGEVYIGIARIFSGVLKKGQPLYVFDPKYQGLDSANHITQLPANIIRPYLVMGRELHAIEEAYAGNIVGLLGLSEYVMKTATLSSSQYCPSFTAMPYQVKPIVRVAVEPENPRDFAALEAGLQRLYRSDPTVEIYVEETGEYVISVLGELHLERCIKDLKERFAQVPVRVSEPLVGFRESIIEGEAVSSDQQSVIFKDLLSMNTSEYAHDDGSEDRTIAVSTTPDGKLKVFVRAIPLPDEIALLLEENVEFLKRISSEENSTQTEISEFAGISKKEHKEAGGMDQFAKSAFRQRLEFLLRNCGNTTEANENEDKKEQDDTYSHTNRNLSKSTIRFWNSLSLDRICSFGPRRVGPNLLINNMPDYTLTTGGVFSCGSINAHENASAKSALLSSLENGIITGFQLATSSGPLCDEPVWGVAFLIEKIDIIDDPEHIEVGGSEADRDFGPLSGQIISTMRIACRVSFLKQPVRLVEAMYLCSVQCQAEQLGKLYKVLNKRRGTIASEELSDGTSLFTVTAWLPVAESFGLATDLLIQTSGAASNPQLSFSHWQLMSDDPFFQPKTEEEREVFGERVYEHNDARKYIEAIRARKGLARDEKIVVHAEKQRTLARKR